MHQVTKKPATHEWQHWTMAHLKSDAKIEAEQSIKEAQEHAETWQSHGEALQAKKDTKESLCKDAILEATRKQKQAEFQKEVLTTDHDAHIAMLEELVEKERRSLEETQKRCDQMMFQEREICAERVRMAEKKAQADVKRANNAATETAEAGEVQVKNAQTALDQKRKQCADRVQEARSWAEERVKKCEDLKWEELQKMYAWVKERGEQMDTTMRSAENLKHAKVSQATQRVDFFDAHLEYYGETLETANYRARERFEEFRAAQHRTNASHVLHSDQTLELAEQREKHAVNRVHTQSVKTIQR